MSTTPFISPISRAREARAALAAARQAALADWREELSGAEERRALAAELIEALAALGADLLQRLDLLPEAAAGDILRALGVPAPAAEPSPRTRVTHVEPPSGLAPATTPLPAEPPRPDAPPAGSLLLAVKRPPVVEIDEAQRTRLQRALESSRSFDRVQVRAPDADPVEVIDDALRVLGQATTTEAPTVAEALAEVDRVDSVVSHQLERWGRTAPEVNRGLTALLTARMRSVQVVCDALDASTALERLDAFFRRVSRHSKETQPGFVWGLSVDHRPQSGAWSEDARQADAAVRALRDVWVRPEDTPTLPPGENLDDALRRLIEDVRGGLDAEAFVERTRLLLKAGVAPDERRLVNLSRAFVAHLDGSVFKELRRVVREELKAEAEAECEARESPVPTDWPHFALTRGKRAVIVGGDPRPDRVERLREVFGFAQLEWAEDATSARRLDALVQRMRNGAFDVVVVLRAFSSHRLSDAVFGEDAAPCLRVLADTYGVHQVRLAIERYAGTLRS